ncbi:MAG: squalene/phytoene synthase family protein [Xanthobacteraceae bacterium]|nr:squalene/phytoene synthase family protein [Xanthobacteraceae bacterium]
MSTSQHDAAEFCAGLVREFDFTRYASTLFVPPEQRRALLALYAFNVEIARVHEHIRQPLAGEIRLQWWTDMLAGQGQGYVEGSPVASELMRAIDAHALPVARLTRLIEAHQFDLYNDPMPDIDMLDAYALDTASALFDLGARIAGAAPDALAEVTRQAGIAETYLHVLTRLPFDASRQQLYVPLDLLAAQGSSADEVFAGRMTPALRAALDELSGLALSHFKLMYGPLMALPPGARRVFLPMAMARRTLERTLLPDFDPYKPQPDSRLRILWTLWRASRSRDFRG